MADVFSLLHFMELYEKRPYTLQYGVSCKSFDTKRVAGQLVETHLLNMIEYIVEMEELGFALNLEL